MVPLNNTSDDDSTSPINNSYDLTSPSINAVDDSTSNYDNLFVSRGVGRGRNIFSPTDQTTSARPSPSLTFAPSPNVQRAFNERNTSNTLAVGCGVGRGQNISRPSNQTTSATIGWEVRRSVGRAGRYSSPYQCLTRTGEEVEEENPLRMSPQSIYFHDVN